MNQHEGLERPDPDDELSGQLRALLGANADLGSRTAEDVDRRLRAGSVSGLCVELLGVGWTTVTTILSDGPAAADEGEQGVRDG